MPDVLFPLFVVLFMSSVLIVFCARKKNNPRKTLNNHGQLCDHLSDTLSNSRKKSNSEQAGKVDNKTGTNQNDKDGMVVEPTQLSTENSKKELEPTSRDDETGRDADSLVKAGNSQASDEGTFQQKKSRRKGKSTRSKTRKSVKGRGLRVQTPRKLENIKEDRTLGTIEEIVPPEKQSAYCAGNP